MKIKKTHSFLLLEMMIAIFLVTISITPMISGSLKYVRSEIKELELIEAQRIAELSFAEIKSQIYQNQIPWEQIPIKKSDSELIDLPDYSLQLPGFDPKKIRRSFLVWGCKKQGTSKQEFRKLRVQLTLFIPGHPIRHPIKRFVKLNAYKKQEEYQDIYQFSYVIFAQKIPTKLDQNS